MEEQEFLTITRHFEVKDENNKNTKDNVRYYTMKIMDLVLQIHIK